MLKNLFKNYVYPVAMLAGSIIGVGFLSLPYITLKVGIWPMLFYFIVLTGLMLFINIIFTEISLKTPDHKRFPGFVEFYLGKTSKIITLIAVILGSMGVLLVYLFVGANFLATITSPFFGGNLLFYVIAYFSLASLIVYIGPSANAKLDFWSLGLLVVILAIIFIEGWPHIKIGNIFSNGFPISHDFKTLFLPYGAIIFSLWGTGLIPEAEEMLGNNKKILKRVVVISTLLVALVYLLFIFLILSITGSQTTESALVGLGEKLPQGIALIAIAIGVITTFTAFISQGIFLKEVFTYDMKLPHFPAWAFTCFIPLILFLLGFNSFISLISFIGGVLLAINGIFILQMYRKLGGSKWVTYPLIVFFLLGMIYSVVYFVS